MTKKLKIKFAKFEKALVMQILEQVGKFVWGNHIRTSYTPELSLNGEVYLRGKDRNRDLKIESMCFSSNAERDEYLAKVVGWITDEQFTVGSGELKVGEMCKFRDGLDGKWREGRLITILPEKYDFRYIFETKAYVRGWDFASYAQPLSQHADPTVEGDIYTWEMEIADE